MILSGHNCLLFNFEMLLSQNTNSDFVAESSWTLSFQELQLLINLYADLVNSRTTLPTAISNEMIWPTTEAKSLTFIEPLALWSARVSADLSLSMRFWVAWMVLFLVLMLYPNHIVSWTGSQTDLGSLIMKPAANKPECTIKLLLLASNGFLPAPKPSSK